MSAGLMPSVACPSLARSRRAAQRAGPELRFDPEAAQPPLLCGRGVPHGRQLRSGVHLCCTSAARDLRSMSIALDGFGHRVATLPLLEGEHGIWRRFRPVTLRSWPV